MAEVRREEREYEEVAECTFRPSITKSSKTLARPRSVSMTHNLMNTTKWDGGKFNDYDS